LGCGYQPERVQAGIYLLFYTLLASLPLLVGILFIIKVHFLQGIKQSNTVQITEQLIKSMQI
jgi:NADH-ubiquinone oxidoreductase chain 4